eukprot:TRINITY_DN1966_c0_g2_i5.p1 TRINITY_DN1966_c0_g2~~TRINITY_DN1966_c0_g2_i5.p1  ORF type:complete len:419 (+),score=69.50 TRINITY_DN1966_c0_g2_i5:228-1484(+)
MLNSTAHIVYHRHEAASSQVPDQHLLGLVVWAITIDSRKLTRIALNDACEACLVLADVGFNHGINESLAKHLLDSSSVITNEQASQNFPLCALPTIQRKISDGLLRWSQNSSIFVSTDSTTLYQEIATPANHTRKVGLSKDVSIHIPSLSMFDDQEVIFIRISLSLTNPYAGNSQLRDRQGAVISPVVSIQAVDSEGNILPVTTNGTLVEIDFGAQDDYQPPSDENQLASTFLFDGGYQPVACINDRPTCTVWDPNTQTWTSSGVQYQVEPTGQSKNQVVCSAATFSEFSIFLEPVKAKSGCSNHWVKDFQTLFVSFTVVYILFTIFTLWQTAQIVMDMWGMTRIPNPSPLILHTVALLLMILRVVYLGSAAADRLSGFQEIDLIVILSLAFFSLYSIHSLMIFIWYVASTFSKKHQM